MFAADLSWADDKVEKVGERRSRKARQREDSLSTASSVDLPLARRPSSVHASTASGSFRRPSFSVRNRPKKYQESPPPPPATALAGVRLKDPALQPEWTITGKIAPKLPSGAPLDPPPPFGSFEIDRPDSKSSGHRTRLGPVFKDMANVKSDQQLRNIWIGNKEDADDFCQSYDQVKERILALQTLKSDGQPGDLPSGKVGVAPTSKTSTAAGKADPRSPPNSGSIFEEPWGLHSAVHELGDPDPPVKRFAGIVHQAPEMGQPNSISGSRAQWGPNGWELHRREDLRSSSVYELSPPDSATAAPPVHPFRESGDDVPRSVSAQQPSSQSQHYQRLVRRMESATPKVTLDRLSEDWEDTSDETIKDELRLEKQLWALTALENHTLDKFVRESQFARLAHPLPPLSLNHSRKILELDGNIGELYRINSLYPDAKITHLATTRSSSTALTAPAHLQHGSPQQRRRPSTVLLPTSVIQHPVGTVYTTRSTTPLPVGNHQQQPFQTQDFSAYAREGASSRQGASTPTEPTSPSALAFANLKAHNNAHFGLAIYDSGWPVVTSTTAEILRQYQDSTSPYSKRANAASRLAQAGRDSLAGTRSVSRASLASDRSVQSHGTHAEWQLVTQGHSWNGLSPGEAYYPQHRSSEGLPPSPPGTASKAQPFAQEKPFAFPRSGYGFPLPLPYANSSMHHIRTARLPALLPSAQLPALLTDCHRVLKPGGVLELRIVDALPERVSCGPKLSSWLEGYLTLGLEKEFRCSRPSVLVRTWARQAGFVGLNGSKITINRCARLPAAASRDSDVIDCIAVQVLREVWKDVWGQYISFPDSDDSDSEDDRQHFKYWWEDDELLRECVHYGTVWDVCTLAVMKPER